MAKLKKAKNGTATSDSTQYFKNIRESALSEGDRIINSGKPGFSKVLKRASDAETAMSRQSKKGKPGYDANGNPIKKKMGGMIKRADGSMSKRGLWDNIRANKGSGKKPTAAMLKQEKKIKAQTKKK